MAKKEDFKQDSFDLSSQTPTIICKSFVLYGSVEETHHIRVEGTIVGDIKQAHTVVIGTTGIVRGNIHAKNLVVFGRIEGNICVTDSISIKSTGRIVGKLNAQIFTLEHGATYEGLIDMRPLVS